MPDVLGRRRDVEERRLHVGFRVAKVQKCRSDGSDEVQILRLYRPLDGASMSQSVTA